MSEVMSNTQLTVNISSVLINGTPTYPTIANLAGGTLVSQSAGQIVVNVGSIATGQVIPITFNMSFPAGFVDNSTSVIT